MYMCTGMALPCNNFLWCMVCGHVIAQWVGIIDGANDVHTCSNKSRNQHA